MKNLKQIKMYVPMFYSGGHWVENPVLYYNGEEVDKRVVNFMSDVMHFLIESEFTKTATKIFLKSHITGEKAAIAEYNNSVKEEDRVDYSKAHNNIYYDAVRFDRAFDGVSVIDELMSDPSKYEWFKQKLHEVTIQFTSQSVQAKEVGFPILCAEMTTELSNKEFQDLLLVMNRYSKKRLERLGNGELEELPLEHIKYFNYLTTNSMLTEDEKKRLRALNKALGIDEDAESKVTDNNGVEQ